MSVAQKPLRIAIVNDYEIVIAGVAAMLAPFSERVSVVELDSQLPVISDVDAILYDTFGQVQGDGVDLEDLVQGSDAKVIIFSWNLQPELIDQALAKGALGYVSKEAAVAEILGAIESVCAGAVVRPRAMTSTDDMLGSWPGRGSGLSPREAEVVALITQGLSNAEIAKLTYLSINSVKTYIRTAYRKIGATRRAQAVIWGMKHGFEPDVLRLVETPRH